MIFQALWTKGILTETRTAFLPVSIFAGDAKKHLILKNILDHSIQSFTALQKHSFIIIIKQNHQQQQYPCSKGCQYHSHSTPKAKIFSMTAAISTHMNKHQRFMQPLKMILCRLASLPTKQCSKDFEIYSKLCPTPIPEPTSDA